MELGFIILDFVGLAVSFAYYKKGLRKSALLTVLLSLLTLVRINWIRWFGAVCVVVITICFILFRTALGGTVLKCFGRDSTGKKM